MKFMHWVFSGLHAFFDIFPLEVTLSLGGVFFALSWIRPRRIVAFPSSGRRASTLFWVGLLGSLVVLTAGTWASWITFLTPTVDSSGFGGWWLRPLALIATGIVLLAAMVALHREPLPAPGERGIAPRRRWWAFLPSTILWVTAAASAALFATSLWQTAIGTTAPQEHTHLFGHVPDKTDLPVFFEFQPGMGYVSGAGWPNHLATLLALAVLLGLLILLLAQDANRPIFARASAAGINEERTATARLIGFIVLGGVLLSLGAVWAHVGFIGTILVGLDADSNGQLLSLVGTGYRDIARPMLYAGYLIQGIGAALLLRLMVDTLRASIAHRRTGSRASTPAPTADAATSAPAAAEGERTP